MKGKPWQIILSNERFSMYAAVHTDGGVITVFEQLSDPNLQIGDLVHGQMDRLGLQIFYNGTNQQQLHVCVLSTNCSMDEALQLVGLK